MAVYRCECGEILDPENGNHNEQNYMVSLSELELITEKISEITDSDNLDFMAFGLFTDNAKSVHSCDSCKRLLILKKDKSSYESIYKLEYPIQSKVKS